MAKFYFFCEGMADQLRSGFIHNHVSAHPSYNPPRSRNELSVYEVKTRRSLKDLESFWRMKKQGLKPDSFSFVHAIKACAHLMALQDGIRIHSEIIGSGFASNPFVCNSLIDMYAKCGHILEAKKVFGNMSVRNVVSWSAMIMGYVRCGKTMEALELYLQHEKEVKPDTFLFAGVLKACASAAALEEGMFVHRHLIESRMVSDVFVGNCLIDMYAKCGRIEEACRVFNNMSDRNVVSWSAMMGAFLQGGEGEKAIRLFQQMQQDGVEPNSITYVAVINACASIGALEKGKLIHSQLNQSGMGSHKFIGSCLIDMYSKCGSIEDARSVFNSMHTRDVVLWGAMSMCYATHGLAKEALLMFEQMCLEGVELDEGSFVPLLLAFSHAGMVDEAHNYFESLTCIYEIQAAIEHYSCMVDLLGRSGCLDEAEKLIQEMRCQPDACVWRSLLNACRIHGDVQMGERAAKKLLQLDPENDSGYVLLSNMYADAGKRNCASI